MALLSPTGFLSSGPGGIAGAGATPLTGQLGSVLGVPLGQAVLSGSFGSGTTLFSLADGNCAVIDIAPDGPMAAVMSVQSTSGDSLTAGNGFLSFAANLGAKYASKALSSLTGGKLSGFFDSNAAGPVLVTGLRGQSKVIFQTQFSLDETVFITEFGDDLSAFQIEGVALIANCNGINFNANVAGLNLGASLKIANPPGAAKVLNYYNGSKLKTRFDQSGKVLPYPKTTITLFDGTVAAEGYIVGLDLGLSDPKTLEMPFVVQMIGRYKDEANSSAFSPNAVGRFLNDAGSAVKNAAASLNPFA